MSNTKRVPRVRHRKTHHHNHQNGIDHHHQNTTNNLNGSSTHNSHPNTNHHHRHHEHDSDSEEYGGGRNNISTTLLSSSTHSNSYLKQHQRRRRKKKKRFENKNNTWSNTISMFMSSLYNRHHGIPISNRCCPTHPATTTTIPTTNNSSTTSSTHNTTTNGNNDHRNNNNRLPLSSSLSSRLSNGMNKTRRRKVFLRRILYCFYAIAMIGFIPLKNYLFGYKAIHGTFCFYMALRQENKLQTSNGSIVEQQKLVYLSIYLSLIKLTVVCLSTPPFFSLPISGFRPSYFTTYLPFLRT